MVILAAFHLHNVRLMLSSRSASPDPDTGRHARTPVSTPEVLNSVNLFITEKTCIYQFMASAVESAQAIEGVRLSTISITGFLVLHCGRPSLGRQTG